MVVPKTLLLGCCCCCCAVPKLNDVPNQLFLRIIIISLSFLFKLLGAIVLVVPNPPDPNPPLAVVTADVPKLKLLLGFVVAVVPNPPRLPNPVVVVGCVAPKPNPPALIYK